MQQAHGGDHHSPPLAADAALRKKKTVMFAFLSKLF
jgi:hypothetical protein